MTIPKNRQAALSEAIKCIREVCIDGGEWNCAVEFKRHAETLITESQSTDALRKTLEKISKEYSHGQAGKIARKALEPAGKEGS